MLPTFSHLTSLRLESCRHLQRTTPDIRGLPALRHLSFAGSADVSACAVLAALAPCTGLTYLDLSWCKGPQQPFGAAVHACRALHALQVLNLSNTSLPHHALSCLASMRGLQSLNLSGFSLATEAPDAASDNARDAPAQPQQSSVLECLAQAPKLTSLELRWTKVRTTLTCATRTRLSHVNSLRAW